MTFTKTISTAWNVFVKHKRLLPLFMLVDGIFILLLTWMQVFFLQKASEHIFTVQRIMQGQMSNASQEEMMRLSSSLMQDVAFKAAYDQILKSIGLFIVCAFAVWIVLKGFAWLLTIRMVRRVDVKAFFKQFVLTSLFWFALFFVLMLFTSQLQGEWAASILLIVIGYFYSICASILPSEKPLRTTWNIAMNWSHMLPVALVNALLLFIATTLPITVSQFNQNIAVALIIIIGLPVIAFTRVYWAVAAKGVK